MPRCRLPRRTGTGRIAPSALLMSCLLPLGALHAQTLGIALDGKSRMVDGEVEILATPTPDRVAFYDTTSTPWRPLGEVAVPISFQGPPSSVAISADRREALVTAFTRADPARANAFTANQTMAVIDLASTPMRAVQTLTLAAAPSSVTLHPDGRHAWVPHTGADSVSVLEKRADRWEVIDVVGFEAGSAPIAAGFSADGAHALLSLPGTGRIAWLSVAQGRPVLPAVHELSAGIGPTALSFCGDTGLAVVANYGKVTGDVDTISLIDTRGVLPRVIDTASVGVSPEGVACAADGRHAAAALQNMSTVPRAHPLHSARSRLVVLAIEDGQLRTLADAEFGGWAQGVGFLDDSRTVFAQSMNEQRVYVFRLDGDTLTPRPGLSFKGGSPAAYGLSGR
ncbi:hypothetical protein ACWKWK_02270 [Pseudoxanthomonas beigongshangi]